MRVHRLGNSPIERIGRSEFDAAVVTERGVERDRARGDLDRQPFEPRVGHQIEQRRGGDKIDRPIERGFQVAIEIWCPRTARR